MNSSTNDFNQSSSSQEVFNNTDISNDMSSLSGSICASTFHSPPVYSVDTTFELIIELLGNCYTMIAINAASLNDIEKCYEDSTANIKKIDILLSHVKDLEDRLDDIDQQQKKASTQIIKLDEQVKNVASATAKETEIINKRLKSITSRISSIEHLCVIRSNYNKKRRVSQE